MLVPGDTQTLFPGTGPFVFLPPPVLIPPIFIPPGEPCDPEDPDKGDCEEPPTEPPIDAPEPGLLIILMTAALIFWRFGRLPS